MPTELENALEDIVNIYHRYAIRNPQDDYLHEEEFKLLLKENAKKFLNETLLVGMSEDVYIGDLFTQADKNGNGFLTFTEFASILILLAINAHNKSHGFGDPEHGRPAHGHGHGHSH